MLVASLVLLFLVASSRVEGAGISRRSFASAMSDSVVKDIDPAYQAFGIIVHMVNPPATAATPLVVAKPKRVCEGVLLSPQVVLTALGCEREEKDTVARYFKFMGENIPYNADDTKQANGYILIKLATQPTKKPTAYPFLSWYTGSQSNNYRYGIPEEIVDGRKVYLSSWLAHKSADYVHDNELDKIKSTLTGCHFDLKAKYIALGCAKMSVCEGDMVLTGSSFFTFTKTANQKIVSISGLVSLRSSGSFCKNARVPSDLLTVDPPTPKDATCDAAYLCSRRFTEYDVQRILARARRLDKAGLKLHSDYIPTDTRIGSFNLRGLAKFSRNYKIAQEETVRNVIERAEILALQEVGTTLAEPRSPDLEDFEKNIIGLMPGRALEAIDHFAFVFDNGRFSLSSDSCKMIHSERIVRCTFVNRATKNKFTIYNVHLSNNYASDRYIQLKEIQDDIVDLRSGRKVVIIAGDFNIGGGKKSPDSSAETIFVDDIKKTMAILKNMHFPDHGPTTYRETVYLDPEEKPVPESHFDRFAISKNVRLMFTHYPEKADDASLTVGTINDGKPGKETPSGFTVPVQQTRVSTKSSSCPPVHHKYEIKNQIDRMTYYEKEMLACSLDSVRTYAPQYRSRDFSDHLPVTFTDRFTNYRVATWNMRSFDPTISKGSTTSQQALKDRKEIKMAAEYTKILNKFNIVAVQELKPTAIPNIVGSASTFDYSKKIVMNKRWYWSKKTPELGFAVDKDLYAKNCEDIDVKEVDKNARPMFMCEIHKLNDNAAGGGKFLMTLFNVHVRGVDKGVGNGKKYRAAAKKRAQAKGREDQAYLVGDFNTQFTDVEANCAIAFYSARFSSYTKLDQFTKLDYVWPVTQSTPGIKGCNVYDPEILHPGTTRDKEFVLPDFEQKHSAFPTVETKTRMKAFAVWNSVSDHYPVYMKFYEPK